jgi:acyl-CoA thioesterase FadM
VSTLPDNLDELPLLNPSEYPNCFVCGPANPVGLHLRVHRDGTDAVAAYRPTIHQEGYPQRFHGGLVALLVDEMLVYAGAPHGVWGVTAKVRYWLRRPIPMDATLELRGRLTQRSDRGFRAVVAIRLPDGQLAAEGEGMCVLWNSDSPAPADAPAGARHSAD